jgi:hypothetical protein
MGWWDKKVCRRNEMFQAKNPMLNVFLKKIVLVNYPMRRSEFVVLSSGTNGLLLLEENWELPICLYPRCESFPREPSSGLTMATKRKAV